VNASDLYIKSISGASVNVKVGVLPTAAAKVSSVVAAASVEQLSTGLGVTVVSAALPSPPVPPPPSSSDKDTVAIGAIVGGMFGVGLLVALAWVCFKRRRPRDSDGHLLMLKPPPLPLTKVMVRGEYTASAVI